jgi:asparagine synthase (glutamine-hydrolysing)
MLAAMGHRGPDDTGTQVVPPPDPMSGHHPAVLLHARLSIFDLSPAGHQPMADRVPCDGQINCATRQTNWVVFNGEVFNFLDLHGELARGGWPCRTRCDTEVILRAHRFWGEACVERFRGFFAWCLLDAQRGTAWFCRDRLGIKPLYLVRPESGGLLFASEVRTLLAAGPALVPPVADPAALESFLAQGAVYGLQSIVRGVELLGPGESLTTDWSGRALKSRTYWRIPFAEDDGDVARACSPAARRSAVGEIGDALREAMKLWLASDVPLGLFLSGGIDSASLATIATELGGTEVQTVSVGVDEPDLDETEAAAVVARALGTRHRALHLTGACVLDQLPSVLAAVDQPTVDGFNTYFVSGAARRAGLTAAISGVGGDELFAGYFSFRDVPRALRLQRLLRRLGVAGALVSGAAGRMTHRGLTKAAQLLSRPTSALALYLLRREVFLPGDRRALLNGSWRADDAAPSGIPARLYRELESRARGLDGANQVSLFEVNGYMQNMLLRDADVFSMAHGLELRVPLLDHKVVERVAALPGAWKTQGPVLKSLLVEAVGRRLPPSVYSTKKRGFAFPWPAWLRGPLRRRAQRATGNGDAWSALGFDPDVPGQIWQRFLRGDARVAPLQILALVVLEDFVTRHGLKGAS